MINSFTGTYRWLSNFWPVVVQYEGMDFPTVEHAYQAAKTIDLEERRQIQLLSTPLEAKRFGRHVTLRNDWESVKLGVMKEFLTQKFSQPEFREKLKATGSTELVEGNTWGDVYWGVCRGNGENNLGKLLMQIRVDL